MPYNPAHDEVDDPAVLADFIARHPLATLITHDGETPDADLVPFLLIDDDVAPTGRSLIAHVARANPLWRERRHEGTSLATFGPVDHYVSPTWYPSKAEHHRAVPTWNYLVVHAWGPLVVHDDPTWVRGAVARLTGAMEKGRENPWRMGQAPRDYTTQMLENIVGISLPVERLVGRFKVSAHRSEADRLGARDGIRGDVDAPNAGTPADAAGELTDAMTTPPQGLPPHA